VGAKALIRREDGVAAVEFGLVAAPFIGLLLALLEAMLIFFAGRLLDVAVTQSSRQILTGSAQTSNITASAFATAVCQNVYALFNCNNLMIDVETYASFSAANTSAPTLHVQCPGPGDQQLAVQPRRSERHRGAACDVSVAGVSRAARPPTLPTCRTAIACWWGPTSSRTSPIK